jgi:hypothetical protein
MGVYIEELSCSTVEFLISRVGALGMSMARNLSCRINVESQSLSRTTFEYGQRDTTYVLVREMMDV